MINKIKLLLIGAFIFLLGNLIGYREGSLKSVETLTKPNEGLIIIPPCSGYGDPYFGPKDLKYPAL